MLIGLIWAQGHDRAIGADGALPWHVPEDMALFRRLTRGRPVIMGRTTWQSLADAYRPLPGRANIVLTRSPAFEAPGAHIAHSWEGACRVAANTGNELAWCIGGAQLYHAAIADADILCVTDIDTSVPGADAFAPEVPAEFEIVASEPARGWLRSKGGLAYRFTLYARGEGAHSAAAGALAELLSE